MSQHSIAQVRLEARHLYTLGWPLILSQVGMMAMGIVDIMMVGRLGDVPLASLALGHSYSMAILMPLFGCVIGLDTFFSQAYGANDKAEVAHWFHHGTILLTLVGVVVMALHFFASPVLGFLGQPTELLPIAHSYTKTLMYSVPALVMFGLMRRLLQGSGRVKEATIAVVLANIINVGVNYVLIYGAFGAPELGVMGCAWATTFSRYTMMLVLWAYGYAQLRDALSAATRRISTDSLVKLVKICGPVAAQLSIEVWAFTASSMMIGWISITAIAAHTITLNLASLSFMLPLGFSAAAATRVGNLIGANKSWGYAAVAALLMGSSVMLLSASAFFLVPTWLAAMYTNQADIIILVATLLPIAGAFQLVDGIQVTAGGILRGAGDTAVPSMASIAAFWLFGLPLGYFCAFPMGMGPVGVWVGLSLGLGAISVLLLFRLRAVHRRGAKRVLTNPGPATSS